MVLTLLITLSLGAEEYPVLSYESVPDWYQLPEGWELGHGSAVGVDSRGNTILFHRDKNPVMVFDPAGKFLRSWGDEEISGAHGLEIDADDNVWVTDREHHVVIKYNSKGEVLLTLGTRDETGVDETHFDKPADIDFGPAGEVYVADGYGNRRVVKFSKDGKFLRTWGKPGKAPGDFDLEVHTLAVDKRGLVYVGEKHTGDPEGRVQVFDGAGKLVGVWNHLGAPWGLDVGLDDRIYLCDGEKNRILKLDLKGKVLGTFGSRGSELGKFYNTHHLAVGPKGEIYVAETRNRRIQKLVEK